MGTADDVATGQIQTLIEPGPDGIYGTADDVRLPIDQLPAADSDSAGHGQQREHGRHAACHQRHRAVQHSSHATPKTYVLTSFGFAVSVNRGDMRRLSKIRAMRFQLAGNDDRHGSGANRSGRRRGAVTPKPARHLDDLPALGNAAGLSRCRQHADQRRQHGRLGHGQSTFRSRCPRVRGRGSGLWL